MRIASRLVSALVALGLLVAAIVGLVEIVAARLGHRQVIVNYDNAFSYGLHNTWHAPSVRAILIGLVALGIGGLVLALAPQRRLALDLQPIHGESTSVRRASVETALAQSATSVDGIASARVRVDRRRVVVSAKSGRRDINGLDDALRERIEGRLQALGLVEVPPVLVHTKGRTE